MSSSCHSHVEHSHCHPKKFDWLLWGSLSLIVLGYVSHLFLATHVPITAQVYSESVFSLMNKMWIGLVFAIFAVGLINEVPRELVTAIFGNSKGLSGILRATLAGLLLDLCSHGILLVGVKLYERGVSIGQVMAFLIASPWNSFSITIVLFLLIGLKWTVLFILLSALIAILSGLLFNSFVNRGWLPSNPNEVESSSGFKFWPEAKKLISNIHWDTKGFKKIISNGATESKMILRWLFFGVVVASLMKTFLSPEDFQTYFGPTWMGLAITALVATIIEVCSEGSAPIGAEILSSAKAPGNGFVFLMAGVSTDYTEVIAIKEGTRSWKIALFLPLITLPQILFLGWLINSYG